MKSQMCAEVKFYFIILTSVMTSEEVNCTYSSVIMSIGDS
jgi:hypothetical protein